MAFVLLFIHFIYKKCIGIYILYFYFQIDYNLIYIQTLFESGTGSVLQYLKNIIVHIGIKIYEMQNIYSKQ